MGHTKDLTGELRVTSVRIAELQKIKQILLDKYDVDVLVDLLQLTGRDVLDTYEEAVVEYYHENPDEFAGLDDGEDDEQYP